MEQTQLVELIKVLSPKERAKLLQFDEISVNSLEKIGKNVKALLAVCLLHPWEDPTKILDKKTLFETVFPDRPFAESRLEKTMVEAHKLVRAFVASQHYFREKNAFQQTMDYAEFIRRRGLQARYQIALGKLRKMQEETPQQHFFYFHNQYELEYAVHNEESLLNQMKGELNIGNTLDALDMHHSLNSLALLNVYLLQKKAANLPFSAPMQERIEHTQVPERFLNNSPVIKINHIIFNLLKKQTYTNLDLQWLFDALIAHEKQIDVETLNGFYAYLRNICNLALSQDPDNEDIIKTLFELYQDNLERGFLHYEGKLIPSRYLGISEFAIKAKATYWALDFIEKYKHEIIGENETQDFYRLNMAHHLFAVGKFEACLDYIPATSPLLDYLMNSKRLEIKAYYELGSDLLDFKMDAFKMFLSRTSQKIFSEAIRKNNQDFLNMVFQLRGSIPGDQARAQRIIARVAKNKSISDRIWLLQKANDLLIPHHNFKNLPPPAHPTDSAEIK